MYGIPTWTEEARALHDDICRARASESSLLASDLRAKLQLSKPKLLRLLDDDSRDSTHRTTLNQGKAYINGNLQKIAPEFAQKALFLSDHLDINEYTAATLLKRGLEEVSYTDDNAIDNAIVLYHQEHEYLLECFEVILTTAKDASVNNNVRSVCYEFMSEIMHTSVPRDTLAGESYGSFIAKIISTIKRYQDDINSIMDTGALSTAQPTSAVGSVTGYGQGTLGEEITEYRIQHLVEECIGLIRIFYHLGSLFWPEPEDVLSFLEMLEKTDLKDYGTPYMIICMIAILSPENHINMDDDYQRKDLSKNEDFLRKFHQRIISQPWKVISIKATIVIQWAMLLEHASLSNPEIKEKLMGAADLSDLVQNAISAKAFVFMNNYLLQFQQEYGNKNVDCGVLKDQIDDEEEMVTDRSIDLNDFSLFNTLIREDFHIYVLYELDILATTFTRTMRGILQTLRYREEDSNAVALSAQQSSIIYPGSNENDTKCHDLEDFFTFLASVYRHRIDAGFQFWTTDERGLFGFTKWLTDIRVPGTVQAVYNFLGSISTGGRCASACYFFLEKHPDSQNTGSNTLFSWGKLVATLQYYAPLLRTTTEDRINRLPPNEESLLKTFLYLFKQVVLYSVHARKQLWEDAVLNVQNSLIEMINSPTSTELRAALYGALAAFCSPSGEDVDGVGRSHALETWNVIEGGQFFVYHPPKEGLTRAQAIASKQVGFIRDLSLERSIGVYSETMAIVELLTSLIHPQNERNELIAGYKTTGFSIPSNLGYDRKSPGAEPYVSLIIDHVFLQLDSFEYLHSESRWQLTEACLKLLENCIMSFDLKPLVYWWRGDKNYEQKISAEEILKTLLRYITHPGFEVLVRLFSGSQLTEKIFRLVGYETESAISWRNMPAFARGSVARCLSIIDRALEVQDAFCNLLVPTILRSLTKSSSPDIVLGDFNFKPIPSITMLSYLMLHNRKILVNIGQLVNSKDYEEICSLSTKIMQTLSADPALNDMTVKSEQGNYVHLDTGGLGREFTMVLQTSSDADSIIYGFSERLGLDYSESITLNDYMYDLNNVPFWRAETMAYNVHQLNEASPRRIQSSIRLAILDLLLKNSVETKSSPTLTEFLLGFEAKDGRGVMSIKDPLSSNAIPTSFHSILDLLRAGLNGKGLPLIATHPLLAEKCHQLIYQLCSKKTTSEPVMRYLRTRENYFYEQFKAMPSNLISYQTTPVHMLPGRVVYPDRGEISIDFFSLRSQLLRRAWILRSVALELHVAAVSGRTSDASQLIELLYGDGNLPEKNATQTTRTLHQPLVKMLEIISSLRFVWHDHVNDSPREFRLESFPAFDDKRFEITNEHGCVVYEIWSVYKFLRGIQRTESLPGTDKWNASEIEIRNIIHVMVIQNHEREIAHGKLCCLEAWKQVVEVSVSECHALFRSNRRSKVIYGLLQMLLPEMCCSPDKNDMMIQGISQVILTLMAQIKTTPRREITLIIKPGNSVTYTLPDLSDVDLAEIFIGISNCIQVNHSSVMVRGNMYITLVEYLTFITKSTQQKDAPLQPLTTLQVEVSNIIQRANPAFLETIYYDTIYSDGVWKTTALTALNALYALTETAETHTVLHFFEKKNFISHRLDAIFDGQTSPSQLRPQDISPVSIALYNAKTSMLLRIATGERGASLLCVHQIFDELCKFNLNKLPHETKDEDELFAKIVTPILRLVVALLCSGGQSNEMTAKQAKLWALSQKDVLKHILSLKPPRTPSAETQWSLTKDILCLLQPTAEFFEATEPQQFSSFWQT
ncbi:nucleoporin Nup186/Nup192/Nup205 [Phycomyces nitens]|nr:nucleoporin Nup186/Nup192/Nup205 [Phycomyces nitens]